MPFLRRSALLRAKPHVIGVGTLVLRPRHAVSTLSQHPLPILALDPAFHPCGISIQKKKTNGDRTIIYIGLGVVSTHSLTAFKSQTIGFVAIVSPPPSLRVTRRVSFVSLRQSHATVRPSVTGLFMIRSNEFNDLPNEHSTAPDRQVHSKKTHFWG